MPCSPIASTISGGVTLDLPFVFPTISPTNGSKVSISSSPFNISPAGGGELSLTFPEENPPTDSSQVPLVQGDDVELPSNQQAGVNESIPLIVPLRLVQGAPTSRGFIGVSFKISDP